MLLVEKGLLLHVKGAGRVALVHILLQTGEGVNESIADTIVAVLGLMMHSVKLREGRWKHVRVGERTFPSRQLSQRRDSAVLAGQLQG